MPNPTIASSFSRFLSHIVCSNDRDSVWFRRILAAILSIAGFANILFTLQSLFPPHVFTKDFVQEYVLACSILNGVMPYLPLPYLALKFIGPMPQAMLYHAAAHPPPVAVLALPLGLLEYRQAAAVWWIFELLCVVFAMHLLLKASHVRTPSLALVFLSLLPFIWHPFYEELMLGQLMTLLLVLLLLGWRALKMKHAIRGGILLGAMISLKFIGWPIILFLVLRKNWRSVGAAIGTVLAANGIAAAFTGYQGLFYYYTKAGFPINTLYRAYAHNFSLYSLGWRLFDGTGSPGIAGATAPPLLASAVLAPSAALLLPLFLVTAGAILAAKAQKFDIGFAIMVCVSILANPVTWLHYLILATLPLYVAGKQLLKQNFPKRRTCLAIGTGALLFISIHQYYNWALMLGMQKIAGDFPVVNPWILNIFTMFPALLILGLIGLLYRLDSRFCVRQSQSPEPGPQA